MDTNDVKLKQLFDEFLQPNFQIKNDVYLNRLLTHLTEKQTRTTVVDEWLLKAVAIWENGAPATNLASFALNLTANLSKDESRFTSLNTNNFYQKLLEILNVQNLDLAPSVKLAYIKFLANILDHKTGIDWIIENHSWKHVLTLCLANQTIYVSREANQFIWHLLDKTVNYNEFFCNGVIRRLFEPLDEKLETNNEIVQKLSPTINLITAIFDLSLQDDNSIKKNADIYVIYIKNLELEEKVNKLLTIAEEKDLLYDLGKLVFVIQFVEFRISLIKNAKFDEIAVFFKKIMEIIQMNITKGFAENVLKFCFNGIYYWSLLNGQNVQCMDSNKQVSLTSQLNVFQLLPIFCLSSRNCVKKLEEDDFRDAYVEKIFKVMCQNTIRIAYTWRNSLMNYQNIFEIATKSILYIMKSRKYYAREQAAIIFQCFIYNLKDFLIMIKTNPETMETFVKETFYISLILDSTVCFIEDYKITWRDSVETICVMAVAFDFLSIPTWPTQLVVKALKLVNISIAKYMSPNLALLIDRTQDSTMALMGPLLYTKLHDSAWEVRDSALEVVCTIAHISITKFPSLQKVLLDSDLPILIVEMSQNDGESFVRATALKGLQEMAKVEEIWMKSFKSVQLPEKICGILQSETEGIVRVQATILLCTIYENQEFSNEILQHIYDIMINAVLTDLHWEVKVKGLDFWQIVIKNHLQNQGMIDGVFPNVTFSKENRKIVNLTEEEIRKRLLKVLEQLSLIGCLGVLITALENDSDMEVMKSALKIIKELNDLLRKYQIYSNDDLKLPSTHLNLNQIQSDFKSSTHLNLGEEKRNFDEIEKVIDQIVNSQDITLLSNVYQSTGDSFSKNNYNGVNVKKIINVKDFLNFTNRDLDSYVNGKLDWMERIDDLSSLLDDMLRNYDSDVNSMDCY